MALPDPAQPPPTEPPAAVRELVERFKTACRQDPAGASLRVFLPPPDHDLRSLALEELIKADLELRAQQGRTISMEGYLEKFPELVDSPFLPQLLYQEYCVRLLCGDDPDLAGYQARFPNQFTGLMAVLQKNLIGTGATQTKATGVPPEVATPRPPEAFPGEMTPGEGKTLSVGGGYKLLNTIGRGSYGEVYRAEAPGGVQVAVKIILRSLDEKESKREGQALELMKNLRHQSLLSIHSFWVLEDQLLIVTELADKSLRERLKECRAAGQPGIPLGELLTYIHESAEALDYLHAHSILHRDIKPDNILLFGRHAKVADFGLAKLFEDRASQVSISGTPVYMAPEVWRGSVSLHSDQYSLALSYAEIRLCRRIFSGDSISDLVNAHLQQAPNLAPLSEEEQAVLHRALAKDPSQRFPSCLAFAEALEMALLHGSGRSARINELMNMPPGNVDSVQRTPTSQASTDVSSGSRRPGSRTDGSVHTLSPSDMLPDELLAAREPGEVASDPEASTAASDGWRNGWGDNEPVTPFRRGRAILIFFLLLICLVVVGPAAYLVWSRVSNPVVEATEATAGSSSDLVQRGLAHLAGRDPETAIADFTSALALNPKQAEVYQYRARAYLDRKESGKALADCNEALKLDDRLALAHLYRAEAYAARREDTAARQDYEAASRLDPKLEVPDFTGEIRVFDGHSKAVTSVALSRDLRRVLSGSYDETARLFDLATGRLVREFNHGAAVKAVALSPDGKTVATAGSDKIVRLWDIDRPAPLQELKHNSAVWSVAFAPDGKSLLTGSGDSDGNEGLLRLWSPSGELLKQFAGHTGPVRSVAFAPDSRRAVSGSNDKTACVWDLTREEKDAKLQTFSGHEGQVVAVAFAPDGKEVASAGFDKKVHVWEAETARPLQTFDKHTGSVWGVSFSPDSKRVLSGSQDKSIRWWEVKNGTVVHTFPELTESVYAVVVSADGRRALSGGGDGKLRLWGLPK